MLDDFAKRHPLLLLAIVPIAAQAVGSAFSITYNVVTIAPPLISEANQESLIQSITIYNALIYPAAIFCWVTIVMRLREPINALRSGQTIEPFQLLKHQQLAINLPWWMLGIGSIAWISCIPFILYHLTNSPDTIDSKVPVHFTISTLVSAMIALTHAFFAAEIVSQGYLFPILFRGTQPSSISGAYPLTLRGRAIAWTISTVFCPIVSILLLFYAQDSGQSLAFPATVGALGVLVGLAAVWMVGRLYGSPIRQLMVAAQRVAQGELDTCVDILRGDEFGPLIEQFNQMTAGLREKESLRNMFGLHVGREAAQQILATNLGLGGSTRHISVMFVDIRGFTSTSQRREPAEVVAILNEFFNAMVDVVETQCNGMVNKYLGDGFMALFGASQDSDRHADDAFDAAAKMLIELRRLNDEFQRRSLASLKIGIGIHSGEALVGSIGCDTRLEYTAIGDTVNVASRVESLTKALHCQVLLTQATRDLLPADLPLVEQPPQMVRGVDTPLTTYSLKPSC